MNKTLNLHHHGIFCTMWRHMKVFTKRFHEKSVCPVIWLATGRRSKPDSWKQYLCVKRFVESFRRTGSSLCYHTILVHICFCICICSIFRFAYLAYCCPCAKLFSVSHSSIMNVFCCLCYMPGIYLKSLMLCLRCVCCLLFSKTS